MFELDAIAGKVEEAEGGFGVVFRASDGVGEVVHPYEEWFLSVSRSLRIWTPIPIHPIKLDKLSNLLWFAVQGMGPPSI